MSAPFQIFSWKEPFLKPLKNYVDEISDGHPGKALIITPHLRPARYLTDLYRKEKKARVLPKMLAINGLVSSWRSFLVDEPLHMANPLDQIAILHECIAELDLANPIATAFPKDKAQLATFLPWAVKLAKLLEDFAIEGREIRDFPNLEDELGSAPAAILSSLREINELWEKKLKDRGWTTPGQDHKFVAANARKIPQFLSPTPDRPIILAGFYILSGTHEILLKSLWEAGAHICLHTDPALIDGHAHWACQYHERWIKKWHAQLELKTEEKEQKTEAAYDFFAGHDLHSQLQEMNKILIDPDKKLKMSTAVIPCKSDALTAILQQLPPANVNISMGYPMERTPIVRFIDSILQMFANSPEAGRFKSDDLLSVIRHPYSCILLNGGADGYKNQLSSLSQLEIKVLKSGLFWQKDKEVSLGGGVIEYLESLFYKNETMLDLGKAIGNLCQWLFENGKESFESYYSLDLEVLYRIIHKIVPVLTDNLLSHEPFAPDVLRDTFMEQIREENIPFQADPIEGLQVLGLLESRLLQFDRILLLDCTDDTLPGKVIQDPLLPEPLRSLAGLPDNQMREASAAYNLFRLLSGAKEAHFLWAEGVASSEFYDSKKNRSRFIERLLWEKEKEKPELLEQKTGLVRHSLVNLHIPARRPKTISRSPEFESALKIFWSRPLSITSFDSYLACPLQFIWNNIMGLCTPFTKKSRDSIAGTFIHKVLENMHKKAIPVTGSPDIQEAFIEECFYEAEKFLKLKEIVSPDDYEALRISVTRIMKRYLEEYKDEEILDTFIESDLTGTVQLHGASIQLKGRTDRLDLRSDGLYVIDYKSTKDRATNKPAFWNNNEFFAEVADACARQDIQAVSNCFAQLQDSVTSLQLPLYLVLLAAEASDKFGAFPANAAWIPLRFDCKEQYLLDSPLQGPDDPRLNNFVQTLNLIYTHMRLMSEFKAVEVSACKICDDSVLCGI